MTIRIAIATSGAVAALSIALATPSAAAPGRAEPASPPPGCGFTSAVPCSPCAEEPPWGHKYPGGYDWAGEVPGKWGRNGYTHCVYYKGCDGM